MRNFRAILGVAVMLLSVSADAQLTLDECQQMASDNYISPVEKTSLKQQMADIESEYLQITGDAELYDVSTTSYAAAYEKAIASLGKYTADTPEYIPVENDFQDIADYYEARQVILMLLDSAKNDYVLEVSNSVKAELKVTTDAITAEVNSVKTVVEGMNEDVSNALLDAQDAKEAAESAKSEAIAAQDRLNDWSADGVISPTEKQSLRDEISRIDADGFLYIDGRLSRFSKIGGEMVPHATVEAALNKELNLIGDVPQIAISSRLDEGKGEALVLLSAADITLAQAKDALRKAGVSNLWQPKYLVRIPEIPLLPSGKLNLKRLARLARA